jgi:hypothetical protein
MRRETSQEEAVVANSTRTEPEALYKDRSREDGGQPTPEARIIVHFDQSFPTTVRDEFSASSAQ